MDPIRRLAAVSIVLACAIALSSCATKPPPAPGQVDVYHKGEYVGAVTGNEPKDEDPPIPHPVTPTN